MRLESDAPQIYIALSSHFGQPKSEILPKILKKIVTIEEAEILVLLPSTPEGISKKTSIPVSKVISILEGLFKRGLVLHQKIENMDGYALCGNLIDSILFEIGQRIKQKNLSKKDLEVIELWEELFEKEIMKKRSPADNVQTARIIPVKKAIEVETLILPSEDIAKIIKDSKVVAVAQCPCRTRARRCKNPLETCILLNETASILIKRGVAREITHEEALNILEQCEDLGLVHHADNASEGFNFICNCCSCCCFFLRGLILYGKRNNAKSRYVSVVNKEICNGCGVCEKRCVFGAMKIVDGVASSDPEKCFGCGLCATKCPTQAIKLKPIRSEEHIPKGKAQSLLPPLPPHNILLENLKKAGFDI
jgi:ferredoxin